MEPNNHIPPLPPLATGDELVALTAAINAARGGEPVLRLVETHPLGRTTQVEHYALTNGLRLLLVVDPAAPVAAYHTWFRVGSRHETPGRTGMAHLFEHMMFKATRNVPEGEFDRRLEEAGVSNNASTWVDWTYYRENLPVAALPLVVALEADRMANLRVDAEQLESERSVVLNERHLRVENDPEGLIFEELYRTAYPTHPYGRPTIGLAEDIAAITVADCEAFYARYYAPNNATLVLVGGVDRVQALELIAAHYGALPPGAVPASELPPEPPQTAPQRVELRLPVAAPMMALAFRSPAMGDPDYLALELANEILLNGDSARLYKLLVTDREIASNVSGWTAPFHYPGLYEVFATIQTDPTDPTDPTDQTDTEGADDPEDADDRAGPDGDRSLADEVLALTLAELRRLATDGPTPEELEKAHNKLEAGLIRGMQTVGARARLLGTYDATEGDFKVFFQAVAAYRAMTADDVRRVLRRVAVPENMTVVMAFPDAKGATAGPDGDDDDDAS